MTRSIADTESADELREHLLRVPPEIPCKYLYDERGSELYESITRQPEYYQARAERSILSREADRIMADVEPAELVELGSGSSRKTRILLDALVRSGGGERCVLLDISGSFLRASARALAGTYPSLEVRGVVGDFHRDLDRLGRGAKRLFVFLAGTIGNLDPEQARTFLTGIARIMTPDDAFLVGVDLVKDPAVLEAAYDDAAGVTAAFDLNVLEVLNARFGADFDTADFEHRSVWVPEHERIEMRLRARRPVRVRVPGASVDLALDEGQEIRTELACKYTRESLEERLEGTGLRLSGWFTDPEERFGLALLRRVEGA